MGLQQITGNEIAAGSIAASDLASASITGDKLGATSINANNIVGGTITTTQIASNTISNTNIQTGAIENYSRATGLLSGMRNRIINGAMTIDQRNAGASITPTSGQFGVDRWFFSLSQASKFTFQQNAGSVTPPAGFQNYIGLTVEASANVTVGSSDFFTVAQYIEGFNVADLDFGLASAKTVTLSFLVRSSLTGAFGGSIRNSSANRNYPFTYTINSANTWEQKSITIDGDTEGTWLKTDGLGLALFLSIGAGSNFTDTADAWTTTGSVIASTGSTNLISTNGATFFITGVQLEVGSTATSFDYLPYGTELALCQRYFCKTFPQSIAPANGLGFNYYLGYSPNSANPITIWKFPVTMRSAPTVTLFNDRVGGTAGQWNTSAVDSANARALGTSTEFVMLDNTSVSLTSTNWWLGGATASIEL